MSLTYHFDQDNCLTNCTLSVDRECYSLVHRINTQTGQKFDQANRQIFRVNNERPASLNQHIFYYWERRKFHPQLISWHIINGDQIHFNIENIHLIQHHNDERFVSPHLNPTSSLFLTTNKQKLLSAKCRFGTILVQFLLENLNSSPTKQRRESCISARDRIVWSNLLLSTDDEENVRTVLSAKISSRYISSRNYQRWCCSDNRRLIESNSYPCLLSAFVYCSWCREISLPSNMQRSLSEQGLQRQETRVIHLIDKLPLQ